VDGRQIKLSKTPEQSYNERVKRVDDAIQLKVPDRVPVVLSLGYFPAKYAGVTCADAFYAPAKWKAAAKKTVIELEPDACNMTGQTSGNALEAIDFKQMLWPGGPGASPYHTHQFVEGEYMKADEYDVFLEDPSDFLMRTYLPRVSGALGPFQKLPHMTVLLFGPTAILGMNGLDEAIAALSKARQEVLSWNSEMNHAEKDMEQLGFPILTKAATFTAFDIISDRLRGMRGSMLDMYRQPDKLLKTCQKLMPILLRSAINRAKSTGNPRVFIPLHRGAEGFMSAKQFETFYWPSFKYLLLGLIEAGLTPCPFFEGDFTSRLDYLLELPKGKILGHFDNSDIKKVKEVLGKTMCIMGNVPASLLQTGTAQEVKDYCKKLIDDIGTGGGFILAPRSSIDEAKPENIRAMLDFTKEYGVYK
jgi:hypothetical protein